MTTQKKLQIIKQATGLTQAKLAERFGVSFATFNSWWNEKSSPRSKMQAVIDELFLEVTGQKIVPKEQLTAKKQIIAKKTKEHKKIIFETSQYFNERYPSRCWSVSQSCCQNSWRQFAGCQLYESPGFNSWCH